MLGIRQSRQATTIVMQSAFWLLEHFAGTAKRARFRPQILWFVAVFSSLIRLLRERPLDTACKCQHAGLYKAIFRCYLAEVVKL